MGDSPILRGAGHCGITDSGPSNCATDSKGSWPLRSEHIGSIEACHRRCRQCERCNYVSYSTRNDECAWYYRCPNLRTIGAGGDSYESWRLRNPPARLSPPPPPPDKALRRGASLDLPRPPNPNPRFAAVGAICNGRSYKGASGTAQIHRAHELGRSIRRSTNRSVDRILFAAGFSAEQLRPLRAAWPRIETVDREALKFFTRADVDPSRPWPRSDQVQTWRKDGQCTVLKLEAWRLTEYDGIALIDGDVCVDADLRPWMRTLHADGAYFWSAAEGRPPRPDGWHDGLNSHLAYLAPSDILHRLLRDKAASGDFMPYTNGEQDVLETVFPVHGLLRVEPPAHRHLAQPSDIGSNCEAVS